MPSHRTPAPRPGLPVRGSRTGRPLMALLDLLGRRWALRVLWELRADPLSFRALRARCDAVSPSVLNLRLRELREAGIVEMERATGYRLTEEGQRLGASLGALQEWADRWGRRVAATRPVAARKILQVGSPRARNPGGGSPETGTGTEEDA